MLGLNLGRIVDTKDLIFISYAREDQPWAERVYLDLRRLQLNAWLDIRCLGAGANWKHEIQKAIKSARFVLLLVSKHSVGKRGFIQREIKQALQTLQELPIGTAFLIPVRLDSTEPIDVELRDLNWVDLLPNYGAGLARILSAFAELEQSPLRFTGAGSPRIPTIVINHGKPVSTDLPLLLGERALVSYAPFRTAKEFLQQFFDRLPTERHFADSGVSYYVTFSTRHERVLLSDDIRARYPQEITIVLHHVFHELTVRNEGVSVILSFDHVKQQVAIPYEAISSIFMPELGIHIYLRQAEQTEAWGWPVGYFEQTAGSFAGEPFDMPDDPPPDTTPE